MNVTDTMTRLTTTEKLEPLDVRVVQPAIKTGTELLKFYMASVMTWLARSLIVWGFLAVFFPALGATYLMVLFGLWAVRHVVPPSLETRVRLIASKRKA